MWPHITVEVYSLHRRLVVHTSTVDGYRRSVPTLPSIGAHSDRRRVPSSWHTLPSTGAHSHREVYTVECTHITVEVHTCESKCTVEVLQSLSQNYLISQYVLATSYSWKISSIVPIPKTPLSKATNWDYLITASGKQTIERHMRKSEFIFQTTLLWTTMGFPTWEVNSHSPTLCIMNGIRS